MSTAPQTPPVDDGGAHERLLELMRAENNAIVRAGAGTGKTYSLVACILHQLAGVNPDQIPIAASRICAITFTEKAAAEMLQRIRERVVKLIDDPEEHLQLTENARRYDMALPDAAHWRRVQRDLGSMVMSTFHGFCAQILREYPVEAGIEPGFTLADELVASTLLAETIENVVYERLARGDGACLRTLRALPVRQGAYGEALVKLVSRVLKRLREDGLKVSELTRRHRPPDGAQLDRDHKRCTQELARQKTMLTMLWSKLDPRLLAKGSAADRALLTDLKTFAAEADELQKRFEALGRRELGDHLASVARYVRPLRRQTRQSRLLGGRIKMRIFNLPTFQDKYLEKLLSHTAEQLRQDFLSILTEVETRYSQRKQAMGALDFTDLLVMARDVMRDQPQVRQALKRRFELVLVDEFQDTNDVQLDLVMLLGEVLAEEVEVPQGKKTLDVVKLAPRRLFLVGDPKQSIYNFRGADVGVFNQVEHRLTTEKAIAKRYPLQQNRRSVSRLIDFGNRWFEAVLGGTDVTDADYMVRFTDDDRLAAVRDEDCGGPPVEFLALPPKATPHDEARAVARWIQHYIHGAGEHLLYRKDGTKNILEPVRRYGQIAILLRQFRNLSAYQDALQRLQIPYYVVKGRGFYGCPEIRDLHMALRLLLDPDDGLALIGVLRSPLCLISDEGLIWLQRTGRGQRRRALTITALEDMMGALPEGLAPDDTDALERFVRTFGSLTRQADRLGPRDLLLTMVEMTRYREKLAGTFRGRQKIGNVEKLLTLADSYERTTHGHLVGFVRRLEVLIEQEPREPEGQVVEESADVVRIMTVHQSKGLEFPVVLLPEVHAMAGRRADGAPIQYDREHGLQVRQRVRHMGQSLADLETEGYESLRKVSKEREEAEERRLVYVAATRARDLLWLSGRGFAREDDGMRSETRQENPLTKLQNLIAQGERACTDQCIERFVPELSVPPEGVDDDAGPVQEQAPVDEQAWHRAVQGAMPTQTQRACPTLTVSQLADFHQCPHRYYLWHVAGLRDGAEDDARNWEGDERGAQMILDEGTAAHAIMEHVDFEALAQASNQAQRRACLQEALGPMEVWLESDRLEEVYKALGFALTDQALLDRLASAQQNDTLVREAPFMLRLEDQGSEVYIKGRFDLLLDDGEGLPWLIDHKFSAPGDGELEPHRFQMAIYALALVASTPASAALPETWRAALLHLRSPGASLQWTQGPMDELNSLQSTLPALALELTRRRQRGLWPRLDQARHQRTARQCQAERCAFARRCWPQAVTPSEP